MPSIEMWDGWWSTEGGGSGTTRQPLELKLEFAESGRLFGSGHDGSSNFQLGGSHTSDMVTFRTSGGRVSRVFAGTKEGQKLSGRWHNEASREQSSGKFELRVKEEETAASPSWSPERLDLYEACDQLGTGGFGIVTKVRRKNDGKILVWKELNYGRMNKNERRMMINEVNILREMRHAHIVRYYDTIIVVEKQKIYIVIEYCENGDLAGLIENFAKRKKRVEEGFCWRVFYQIALALQACHKRPDKILHRDLKPANILLGATYDVKVCDFGLATLVGTESLAYSKVGTPLYMSPEQMAGTGYTERSDLWSLGCIIYELAALVPPFDADNQFDLQRRIQAGKFARLPSEYSDMLNRTVTWCLQPRPDTRPNIDELVKFLAEQLRRYTRGGENPVPHKSTRDVEAAPVDSDRLQNGSTRGRVEIGNPAATAAPSGLGSQHSLAVGVGIVLGPGAGGRTIVQDLTEGGAAERSGIVARGDMLISVDDTDVRDHSISSIGQRLRGAEGSLITLGLVRWEDRREKNYKVVLRRGWPSATGSAASALSGAGTTAQGGSGTNHELPQNIPLAPEHLHSPLQTAREHEIVSKLAAGGEGASAATNSDAKPSPAISYPTVGLSSQRREPQPIGLENKLGNMKLEGSYDQASIRNVDGGERERTHPVVVGMMQSVPSNTNLPTSPSKKEALPDRRGPATTLATDDERSRDFRTRYLPFENRTAAGGNNNLASVKPELSSLRTARGFEDGLGGGAVAGESSKYLSEPVRYRPMMGMGSLDAGSYTSRPIREESIHLGATIGESVRVPDDNSGGYALASLQREIREHRVGLERVQQELQAGREREIQLRQRVEQERSMREAAEARLVQTLSSNTPTNRAGVPSGGTYSTLASGGSITIGGSSYTSSIHANHHHTAPGPAHHSQPHSLMSSHMRPAGSTTGRSLADPTPSWHIPGTSGSAASSHYTNQGSLYSTGGSSVGGYGGGIPTNVGDYQQQQYRSAIPPSLWTTGATSNQYPRTTTYSSHSAHTSHPPTQNNPHGESSATSGSTEEFWSLSC